MWDWNVANVALEMQQLPWNLRKFPWDFWNWFDAGMVALWVLSETWFQVWGPMSFQPVTGWPAVRKVPLAASINFICTKKVGMLIYLPTFFIYFLEMLRCLTTCPRLTHGHDKPQHFDALAQSMDERIIRLARTARLFRSLVLARFHFPWHACRFALEDDIMRVKQKLDSKL